VDERTGRDWLRAATTPRLIGIFLILVIGAAVCLRLGLWQLDRAQIRGEQAAAVEVAELESAEPVPLASVVGPQTQLNQDMVGTPVVLEGVFDQPEQFYVVNQAHEGETGYYVLNGLTLTSGEHSGAVVPIVRGWVPEPDEAYAQALPGAGQEEVTVTGYLGPSQGAEEQLPEPDMLGSVSAAELVNVWGTPIYSAHVRLAEPEPGPGLPPGTPQIQVVGAPQIENAGLNLQNLAYAGEWWIFGAFALFLWWRMVRDEVRHQRREREKAAAAPDRDTGSPAPSEQLSGSAAS